MKFEKPMRDVNEKDRKGFKGLTWSFPEEINGKCVFVSKTDKLPGTRMITGAPKFWSSTDPKKNNILYIPELGIAGEERDLFRALHAAGYTSEKCKLYTSTAISKDNYETTHKERFQAAKKLAKGKKDKFNESCEKVIECSNYINAGRNMCFLDSKHQELGKLNNKKKIMEKKTPEDLLRAKYEALGENMALDFTKLDQESLKGVISRKIKEENRGPYYHVAGYDIISKDKENYKFALNILEKDNAEDIYQEAKEYFAKYQKLLEKKEREKKEKEKKKESNKQKEKKEQKGQKEKKGGNKKKVEISEDSSEQELPEELPVGDYSSDSEQNTAVEDPSESSDSEDAF